MGGKSAKTGKKQGNSGDPTREDLLWFEEMESADQVQMLKRDILRHVLSSMGSDYRRTGKYNFFMGLALAVRDRLIHRWIETQRGYYDQDVKRVYYLSLEYLPGRFLTTNLHNMGLYEAAKQALDDLGMDLEELAEMESDAGLGNGGLGRLASCFLDSMATLNIPGYGYGIRYDYGIFTQDIVNGWQVERPDNWMRHGSPWEFTRNLGLYEVNFYGRVAETTDALGQKRYDWVDTETIMAMACDTILPGYATRNVTNMRLWAAKSSKDFNLSFFNTGDYVRAVEDKVRSENISKVLYPSEEAIEGRELRFKQQYFFVSATLQDILRRYRKHNSTFDALPDKVAIQLNETHPAIAIPELMRILLDKERLDWDKAWDICRRTFFYTNHTIMPEALETWPVSLFERVLPRHLDIVYEVNHRFMGQLEERYPGDDERKARMSIIQEQPDRRVRMAHLALVGSSKVNGVSAIHTEIIKAHVFKDFYECFPEQFINKTNGITPREWLLECNPSLTRLINDRIGDGWVRQLDALRELKNHADEPAFQQAWRQSRQENKERLAQHVLAMLGIEVDPESLFDVQVKRMHEYKRQLMNVLHVITLYNRIRDGLKPTPRTVFFAGKAAPAYTMAKLIIKLIHGVANAVNNDPRVNRRLKVVFLPNYSVSLAQILVPAAELSEQISTAGTEASGTGNMKFALNGALTIGTWDGATIEMAEEIGPELLFLFGHKADELQELRRQGYDPRRCYEENRELRTALDQIASGHFSPDDSHRFKPILDSLLFHGDHFFVLADYAAYVAAQEQAAALYADQDEWTRRSILNTAGMGKFSSDRAIMEYASEIWGVSPLE